MKQSDVIQLVQDDLWGRWRRQRDDLAEIDAWANGTPPTPNVPRGATGQHRHLARIARSPWLGLVVTNLAQALYVDGFRSPEATTNSTAWKAWEANDFDARQVPIHRAALMFGEAFVTVLPGRNPGRNPEGSRSVMRGVSPRQMLAVYTDPAADEWPVYALALRAAGKHWRARLFDDELVHELAFDGEVISVVGSSPHRAGICPVVRYTNLLDLDGRTTGEVAPYIDLGRRIDKTAYDRLMTQHFNSWKVRTAVGIDLTASAPKDATDEERAEVARSAQLKISQSEILTAADPDTKFGTLDETPLDGFIRAYEADVETLAALTQVPVHTGKITNLSAEALAELRAGFTQKVVERQKSFGKSHAQALRLAARIEGDTDAANDFRSHVTWQDMQIRSLSQAVDALGKAAQMLQVPPQMLWSHIPGVEKADVDEWMAFMDANPSDAQMLAASISRQTEY